jgi:hypothetical protein
MSSRFQHLSWKSVQPGHIVEGVWFQPPRVMPNKHGAGSIILGEVEHEDGRRTGFTCPTMLQQQLADTPIGSHVKIEYLGTLLTANGHQMMKFATTIKTTENEK